MPYFLLKFCVPVVPRRKISDVKKRFKTNCLESSKYQEGKRTLSELIGDENRSGFRLFEKGKSTGKNILPILTQIHVLREPTMLEKVSLPILI
jgi:hypothetical protein